jgi:hypothetical protein
MPSPAAGREPGLEEDPEQHPPVERLRGPVGAPGRLVVGCLAVAVSGHGRSGVPLAGGVGALVGVERRYRAKIALRRASWSSLDRSLGSIAFLIIAFSAEVEFL